MAAETGRGRPGEGDLRTRDQHVHNDSTPRCWICGRSLHATKSVLLGIGPRCWDNRMGAA